MRVKVTEVNFTSDKSWIFKFIDSKKVEYIALDSNSYRALNINSPLNKMHLDSLDLNSSVIIEFTEHSGKNIVTKIK